MRSGFFALMVWSEGKEPIAIIFLHSCRFSLVQSLSRVWLFVTPWTAALQASLSITNSRSWLRLMSIKSVMPSNHLIFCCPFLLPPSIFPRFRVFSNESVLHIRLDKAMATHSSVLAWRIPGTVEPGGLPSMGSHRVGHDWSNLAAAAAPINMLKF